MTIYFLSVISFFVLILCFRSSINKSKSRRRKIGSADRYFYPTRHYQAQPQLYGEWQPGYAEAFRNFSN